jgi:hypothetical protein
MELNKLTIGDSQVEQADSKPIDVFLTKSRMTK